MQQLTLFEKLKLLIEMIFSSSFFFVVMVSAIVITVALIKTDKEDRKKRNYIFIGIYVLIIGFVLIKYGNSILSMLDNLMDNIFTTIYFPNLASYIVMLLITNVIIVVTFFSKKIGNLVKIINIACFTFIEFLFVLILDIIIRNNVDIYSKLEVYTNTNLLVLIELSMIVFALWLITLGIICVIDKLNNKVNYNSTKMHVNRNSKSNWDINNQQLINDIKYNSIKENDMSKIEKSKNVIKDKINIIKSSIKNEKEIPDNIKDKEQVARIKIPFSKPTIEKTNNFQKNVNNNSKLNQDVSFADSLNEQFVINNNDIDDKFLPNHSSTIADLINKKNLTLDDYKKLKELLDDGKKNNTLSKDELDLIMNKFKGN